MLSCEFLCESLSTVPLADDNSLMPAETEIDVDEQQRHWALVLLIAVVVKVILGRFYGTVSHYSQGIGE